MFDFVRILLIAVAAVLCITIIKDKTPSLAFVLPIAAIACGVYLLMPTAGALLKSVQRVLSLSGLDSALFSPLLKVVCIGASAKIAAEICRDAGEKGIAAKVELAAVLCGMLCAVPLVEQALRMIEAM